MNNLKKRAYIVFVLLMLLICPSVGSVQVSKTVQYSGDFTPFGTGIRKEYLLPKAAITDNWPAYLRFYFQLNPGQVIAELNGEVILDADNRTITIRGTQGQFRTKGGLILTGKLVGDFEILGWEVYHEWDIPGFPQIDQSWDDTDTFQSLLLDRTKPAEVEAKLRNLVTIKISAIDIAKLIIDGLTAGTTKVIPSKVIDKIQDWIDAGLKANGGLSSELALYGEAIFVNGEYIHREGQSISASGLDLSLSSYPVSSEYVEHLTFNLNSVLSIDFYTVLKPPLIGEIWSLPRLELVEVSLPLLPNVRADVDFDTTPNSIVFPIEQTSANQPPQTVSSINVHSLTPHGSVATVDVSPYFSDPDSDSLTYSAESSNTSIAQVSVSGSQVAITPRNEGSTTVTVTASDGVLTATQSFSVNVQATNTTCQFDLSQSSQDVLAAGGSLQVGVTTTSGCNWRATTSSNFLSVSPSSGTGRGTVTVTVAENTSTRSRNGTVQIAGQTFRVNQDGKRTIASQTLSRGDAVIVQNTLGLGLNVRSDAGTNNPWIGRVFDGATGEIQDGPEDAKNGEDDYKWYEVEWDHGVTGWSVEAIDEDLLLLRRPPDLAIESFDVSDRTVDPGETFTLSLRVRNVGYNRSTTTDLYYYHTSTSPLTSTDDLTLVGTDTVSGLNPDRSSNESIRVKAPLTAGTYYYAAALINNGEDPNIVNNFVPSKERVTVNELSYPDLVVESFSVSDDTVAPGERLKLSATVRNEGNGGSRSTTLRYYRSSDSTISTNDTQVETDGVNSLDPDETDDESAYVTAPREAGVYYYGACVDSVRDESNTNNNCSNGVRVTVRSPDLVVENVSVSTNTVTIGESFTLSATVRNQGSGPAVNTTLRYYRSSDSTISRNDTQVEADSVRSLAAGTTSNESETIRPSKAGTYYYGVCVDSVTGESNRNNNCSTGNLVTVRPLNQAPVAVDDTATVAKGSTVSIDVLADDTDAENNPLTVVLVSPPTRGTTTVNTDKTIRYTHDGSNTTRDRFTYKVNDGTTDSEVATVTITVTPTSKVINISDANLRSAIEVALDKPAGATITNLDMMTLTSLSASNQNINTLTGLEFATNLIRLDLSYAYVSDQFVNSNSVSDLSPLAGLTRLKSLNLAGNNISDISQLTGLTHLTELLLSNNSVSNISPLAGLTNLTLLSLFNNAVSDLAPLLENTGLGDGDSVDVDGNPLNANSVNTIIPTLKSRGVDVNFEVNTNPEPNSAQTVVKISGDNQQGTPGAVLANPFIVEVRDAANNGVQGIDVTFAVTDGGGTLSETTVTTNADGRAQTTLTLGSQPGPNTVRVSVEGISEQVIFNSNSNTDPSGVCARTPQVRDAILAKIAGVSDCANITQAHLNAITGRMELSNKQITTLEEGDFIELNNLTRLVLENNQLTALDANIFTGLNSLTYLSLNTNPLSTLPAGVFSGLPSLTSLALEITPLTTLDSNLFSGLNSLTNLYLGQNQLSTLPAGVFSGLSNLTGLYLYDNQLSKLPAGVFSGLSNLTILELHTNPGAPFTLTLKLARTDDTNLTAPGPATVKVKLAEGAPFNMSVSLSVQGGVLSANTATIAAGTTESGAITVTQSGTGSVTVSLGTVPEIPQEQHRHPERYYTGIQMAVGDSLVLFGPGSIPTQLVKISGDNQQGAFGTTLANPLVVEVRDAANNGVQGIDVTFAVTAGGGTLSETTVTTHSNGRAQTTLTLGNQPGQNTVRASVQGIAEPVTFNAEGSRTTTAPVFTEGASTTREIAENTATGENIGAPVAATDADNDTLTYTLGGTDAASFGIDSRTGQLKTKAALNHETKSSYMVTITVSDGTDTDTITVTIRVIAAINIPDANLRTRLESALGKQAGDPITDTEMATLTRLDARNANISDLTGLEHATTLRMLRLDGNRIIDFEPLTSLTQLEELGLNDTRLVDLSPLTGLTRLTFARLERNNISDLSPLVAKTGLGGGDTVDVRGNPLSYLSIQTHIPILQTRGVTVEFDTRTPTTLEKVSGDNQHGPPGVALANPFVVEVKDQHSEGFEGVPVTFTVTEGGGVLSNQTVETDRHGRAETILTLGPERGLNTVSVSVEAISEPVIFNTGTEFTIPDPNLRAKIERALNKKPGAPITTAEMATLTRLNARYANIRDLTGLKFATNLTSLDLEGNRLTTLYSGVFEGLTRVTNLNLNRNPLTTIEGGAFNGLSSLQTLDLSSRGLTTIESGTFSGLSSLTTLNLNRNPLKTIKVNAFNGLTSLKSLILDFHQLETIEANAFNGLTNLQTLDLEGNRLTTLPTDVFNGLSNLISLNLNRNPLTTIQTDAFKSLSGLTRLDLDFHQLKIIEGGAFKGLTSLRTLDLEGNKLTTLPTGVFEGLSKLTSLNLNDNPLTTIRADAFKSIPGLTTLILDFHQLETIEANAFNGLTNLQTLDLEGNRLTTLPTDVFNGLSNLTSLNLNRNPLTTIQTDAFKSLSSLQTLILDFHQLITIEKGAFKGLSSLKTLDLESNQLATLSTGVFEGLSSLTKLNLNRNPGTPFTLTLELIRTDTTDTTTPGPATVVVKLAQGAPFEMTVNLSIEGGTLSAPAATIARGKTESEPITVTQEGVGAVTIGLGDAPRIPSRYSGIRMAVSDALVLFGPGSIPTQLVKISGDNQQGTFGTTLANPLVVEVRDAENSGVQSIDVTFAVTDGGGTLSTTRTSTDRNGRAETTLTLGPNLGTNTVSVSAAGVQQQITFNAVATPPETKVMVIEGTITNKDGTLAEAGLHITVTIGSNTQTGVSEAGGVYRVTIINPLEVIARSLDTVEVQVVRQTTRESARQTIQLSPEQVIAQNATIDIQFSIKEYLLSVPAGISLIHVPLKVTAVDGVPKTIASIGDLYDVLGGANTVSLLITHDAKNQQWSSFFNDRDKGTDADKPLTDDLGIIASMRAPASIHLSGDSLGTNGSSSITLHPGTNLVGIPLNDSRIARVSDLFALKGIGGNVAVIIVSDNGEFLVVARPGDAGDVQLTGGQAFLMTARAAAKVPITGEGWSNVTSTTVAPPRILTGIQANEATPVLAVTGSIVGEVSGLDKAGTRVTVKNLSTGKVAAAVSNDDGVGYQLTFVELETGRAAQIGDTLEISAQSSNPLIGVHPLRYVVTPEDVQRGHIQLDELIAYEIPAKTALLPNYPNPFNPDTWIPYHLAHAADVMITIYNTKGIIVRRLELGHQPAGFYTARSKAAYWNGRNANGESVASGVYFYQLRAGDYSALRRMVIVK